MACLSSFLIYVTGVLIRELVLFGIGRDREPDGGRLRCVWTSNKTSGEFFYAPRFRFVSRCTFSH